jgi:hypothetical protein
VINPKPLITRGMENDEQLAHGPNDCIRVALHRCFTLAFALTYRQFHLCAWPLLILFYMLHWRWQGVAFRLDYPRSERLVALVKFRRSATDPNYYPAD